MADEKYSIDDILKEISTSRAGKQGKSAYNESVTEILDDGDEIDKLLRSGKQQPRKRDYSVTEVINSVPTAKQREPAKSARQLSEDEYNARLARDIAKAKEKKPARSPLFDESTELPARQRTDREVEQRIAKDVANAMDLKRYEELTSFGEEDNSDDDVKTYTPERGQKFDEFDESESEFDDFEEDTAEDAAPDSDDEIILHDANTFVPSETMEMRRQKRLAEFKKSMLKYDSKTENLNDIMDSLNPMESREKAAAKLKSEEEDTDTLAVSGNELKSIGKGERIKEYTPAVSRRREQAEEEPAAAKQAPFTGELHVGESIIDALNKKISEQEPDVIENDVVSLGAPESEEEEPAEEEPNEELEKIRLANELAKKKKRRLSEFIIEKPVDLENTDNLPKPEQSELPEEPEEEEETPIDLNDEEVIRERLARAGKGLWGRLIILAVLFGLAAFIGAFNLFGWRIGRLGNMFSYRSSPENYLYAHLAIGVLSFTACSSVISNGLSRLFKLRPDGDTLCALAHLGAIIAIVPYLFSNIYIQRGFSHIYLMVSLGAMIFNTVSKLLTVKTAQKNFDFVFGSASKYFVEHCTGNSSEKLAKGAVEGMPSIASMRKTEMVCDFIVSTYCEDAADRTSRRLVPIAIIAAIVGGVLAFFTCRTDLSECRASWASTVSSAILAVSAAFSSSMTVTLPVYLASRRAKSRGAAVLGYEAAEEMSETNAVLTTAKMLFPANTVKIVNICGYDTPKTRGEGKINIDEAIIYAASLAMATDSVMSDALFHILNYKKELLKPVSGCVYENNLGVMGWIDRRRVLLGTREHMKAHEITVPNTKKEAAANKNNDEVIYLAVGGEVCLLFFVRPLADPEIRRAVRELAFRDITLIVKTVDGMITAPVLAKVFGIYQENVKILPFDAHDTFDENTKFVSEGSAAVTCAGTFPSLSNSIVVSRAIRDRATIGSIMQAVGVGLGILTALIFMLAAGEDQLRKFNLFNVFYMLLFNTVWGALTLGVQFFRRI